MFTSLAISGGAVKVLAVIGCIRYMEDKDHTRHIKHIAGTSFGAVLSFMLALDYTSHEMEEFFESILRDPTIMQFDTEQALLILDTFGLNNGDAIMNLLRRILQRKTFKKDITFMDLAKMKGKHLIVCAANLTDEKEEYFNVDTHPDMSVLLAIRMSCSIPILLTPIHWKNKVYVDGCVYNNFPIKYFSDHSLRDILGINIIVRRNPEQLQTSIWDYLIYMIHSVIDKANLCAPSPSTQNVCQLIMEDVEWFSFTDFQITLTEEKIKNLVTLGYDTMQQRFTPPEPLQTE